MTDFYWDIAKATAISALVIFGFLYLASPMLMVDEEVPVHMKKLVAWIKSKLK